MLFMRVSKRHPFPATFIGFIQEIPGERRMVINPTPLA